MTKVYLEDAATYLYKEGSNITHKIKVISILCVTTIKIRQTKSKYTIFKRSRNFFIFIGSLAQGSDDQFPLICKLVTLEYCIHTVSHHSLKRFSLSSKIM